ncbi:protein kinase domain-containing protein [Paraliomyxa miuraensis]|uniref:protein kinase domain-containing protein n=1 Tax=Paraliomyxa miuraensis TaxID=376150 RepID=UPI00225893D1|nr:protein kinase [Paraliomyxa miuraensis]MCX4240442.1 protein kinase [Paraliomyxa miuraensis]
MSEGPGEDEAVSISTDPLAETLLGDASEDGSAADEPGERLGRYRLVRPLGQGGMGLVYLAHDDQLDRPVALKVLRPGSNGDSRRLLREARSMARLSHPHIAAVYDVGEHDGDVYVAMEYVEGQTMRAWMKEPPDWPQRRDVLLQAARGLCAAHERGVVHRDFKPENVIVGSDGRVRVLDFGLAKLAPRAAGRAEDTTDTLQGSIVGSPRYMAPEQLRGQSAGPSADQFAFCVTAYELAYGQRPFAGEVFADVAASVLTQPPRVPPRVPDVPAALWSVLQRGMRIEHAQRHPSMQSLIAALEQVTGASTDTPAPVVSRPELRDAQEDARARLAQAYADDLLDADELDSRLERLENAGDLPVVAALVADLMRSVDSGAALVLAGSEVLAPSQPAPTNLPAVVDAPAEGRIVAVFSGSRRAGVWQPARVNHVMAVFGGAEVDLREAQLPPGEIELRVFCMFGGVEITVAPGTRVQLECSAIFGGVEQEDASAPPDPGGTVIRVTGMVFFGGVEVLERLPGESGWAARKRRKEARRQLRAARAAKNALPPKR